MQEANIGSYPQYTHLEKKKHVRKNTAKKNRETDKTKKIQNTGVDEPAKLELFTQINKTLIPMCSFQE